MLMSCNEQRISEDDIEETCQRNVLKEKNAVLDDMIAMNIQDDV